MHDARFEEGQAGAHNTNLKLTARHMHTGQQHERTLCAIHKSCCPHLVLRSPPPTHVAAWPARTHTRTCVSSAPDCAGPTGAHGPPRTCDHPRERPVRRMTCGVYWAADSIMIEELKD